jgi:hypothetical protein
LVQRNGSQGQQKSSLKQAMRYSLHESKPNQETPGEAIASRTLICAITWSCKQNTIGRESKPNQEKALRGAGFATKRKGDEWVSRDLACV